MNIIEILIFVDFVRKIMNVIKLEIIVNYLVEKKAQLITNVI